MPVKSRLLVGVGAWLLGAVTATTGSMIAVNELAHGLLGQQTQQLASATISADLDAGPSGPSPAAARPGGTASASRPAAKVKLAAPSAAAPASAAGPGQSSSGTLLVSADGSVMAACQAAGAYLLYWSPDQGFQADDVSRGPAAITSVTFRGPAGSVVMRVSCQAGTPVAHLYQPSADDGSDDGSGD